MELRDYLLLLRRRWRIILIAVLLSVTAAAVVTYRMTPHYTASVKLFVSPGGLRDPLAVYQGGHFAEQRTKSYADLMRSHRVLDAVVRRLDLPTTPERLQRRVATEVVPDTVMFKATVSDPSPERAARIADALAAELIAFVERLERPASGSGAPVRVTLIDPATTPVTPAYPRPLYNLLGALAAGLLAGFGVAVARERLDRSVKSAERLTELTGAPTLGVVCYDAKAPKLPLITHLEPRSARTEAFRQLRTGLLFVDAEAAARSIVVTSCRAAEGKSTTVSNLAISLAQTGRRVVLVDADLRRPCLAGYLGIEGAAGLTDVLVGRAVLTDVLQPWGDLPLRVLPSGPIPPNPSELLGSARMRTLLGHLTANADVVLFDAPPSLPVTDAVVLARQCDGAILVVRQGVTTEDQIRRVTGMFADVDARLLGAVLNMVPSKGPDADPYGYGYGYPVAEAAASASRGGSHRRTAGPVLGVPLLDAARTAGDGWVYRPHDGDQGSRTSANSAR